MRKTRLTELVGAFLIVASVLAPHSTAKADSGIYQPKNVRHSADSGIYQPKSVRHIA